jgi:hypothetical protein
MRFVKKDRELFKCYISKSMKGAHVRGGEPVLKKKLKRVKRRLTMMMKFLLGLFVVTMCVVGYCGYKGIQGWRTVRAGMGPAAASPGAGGTRSGNGGALWQLRTETLRATDGRSYLITDSAEYYRGEMSPSGYVQGIQGHVALLITPEGGKLYIVAGDEKSGSGSASVPPVSQVVSVSNAAGSGLLRGMMH